jgi:dTMP kinase
MVNSGLFVAIEGIDGSGKSTLAAQLGPALVGCGTSVEIIGKASRPADSFGRGQLDGIAQALWHYPREADIALLGDRYWLHLLAAWFTAVERFLVHPALARGQLVVVDGWVGKYIARFALKPAFDFDALAPFFATLVAPDVTLWLDLPPGTAFGRRDDFKPSECGQAEGESDSRQFDFVSYQGLVAQNLGAMARDGGWCRIDAAGHPASVLHQAQDAILAEARIRHDPRARDAPQVPAIR